MSSARRVWGAGAVRLLPPPALTPFTCAFRRPYLSPVRAHSPAAHAPRPPPPAPVRSPPARLSSCRVVVQGLECLVQSVRWLMITALLVAGDVAIAEFQCAHPTPPPPLHLHPHPPARARPTLPPTNSITSTRPHLPRHSPHTLTQTHTKSPRPHPSRTHPPETPRHHATPAPRRCCRSALEALPQLQLSLAKLPFLEDCLLGLLKCNVHPILKLALTRMEGGFLEDILMVRLRTACHGDA